jgi:ribonuclease VapC
VIAVDTSAIVAIVFGEPEREPFRKTIARSAKAVVSSVNVVEMRMVVQGRRGQRGTVVLEEILALPVFEIVPPGAPEIEAAYAAYIMYGKGSGHPAGLNFGDLFSYALAKVRGIPLLFKGNDFSHTDIEAAAIPSS